MSAADRLACTLGVLGVMLLLVPATAVAEPLAPAESSVPTAQQRAYGADWLPFVDPADLPPVDERPVVCLIDSGVDVTPDLPADRPEGPIVERRSIVGEDGTGGPDPHGTRMASMMGAVANGTGTVGAVPWVRIVSIQAKKHGEGGFPGARYGRALEECRTEVGRVRPLAVANLSLGCGCDLTPEQIDILVDRQRALRAFGVLTVTAAGNVAGAGLQSPADAPGVLAVAAGSMASELCGYGSWAPSALLGPACGGVEISEDGLTPTVTDTGGSSGATAFTSAVVAALKTFRPEASAEQTETWLRSGARSAGGRAIVDAEGAFRAAGLGAVVERARARSAAIGAPPVPGRPGDVVFGTPTSTTEPVAADAAPAPRVRPPGDPHTVTRRRMVRPKVSMRWIAGQLKILARNHPVGAVLEVRAQRVIGRRSVSIGRVIEIRSSRHALRLARRPDRVLLRYLPRAAPWPGLRASRMERLKRRRSGWYR